MKRSLRFSFLSLALLLSGSTLFAEGTMQPASPNSQKMIHPCHQIKAACKAAGYFDGGHKTGKGLWLDCIQPIMAGKSVANVNVSTADVQACQARKAEMGKKW